MVVAPLHQGRVTDPPLRKTHYPITYGTESAVRFYDETRPAVAD